MKFIKKNLYTILLIILFVIVPVFTLYADGETCDPSAGKICDPLGKNGTVDVSTFIHDVLEGAFIIGIPIVALAVIYSGFLFVFAMGNPEKLKKAKDALLYTLIGTGLLFGAWAIANLIVDVVKNIGE